MPHNKSSKSTKMRLSKRHRKSASKRKMKGGSTYSYHLAVGQERIGGLAEVASQSGPLPSAYSPKHFNDKIVPLYMKPNQGVQQPDSKNCASFQKGGSKKVHRKSHKKVTRGGAAELSVFNPNMNTRTFNCNQPYWAPTCV
jgi:hypothetical protein